MSLTQQRDQTVAHTPDVLSLVEWVCYKLKALGVLQVTLHRWQTMKTF